MTRPALLDEEAKMSLENCQTCKFVGYCSFSRSRVIMKCDEYEDVRSAPSFDWDLKELEQLRESIRADAETHLA
jgi:hypothetical protein